MSVTSIQDQLLKKPICLVKLRLISFLSTVINYVKLITLDIERVEIDTIQVCIKTELGFCAVGGKLQHNFLFKKWDIGLNK